jgi:hypothetical protein
LDFPYVETGQVKNRLKRKEPHPIARRDLSSYSQPPLSIFWKEETTPSEEKSQKEIILRNFYKNQSPSFIDYYKKKKAEELKKSRILSSLYGVTPRPRPVPVPVPVPVPRPVLAETQGLGLGEGKREQQVFFAITLLNAQEPSLKDFEGNIGSIFSKDPYVGTFVLFPSTKASTSEFSNIMLSIDAKNWNIDANAINLLSRDKEYESKYINALSVFADELEKSSETKSLTIGNYIELISLSLLEFAPHLLHSWAENICDVISKIGKFVYINNDGLVFNELTSDGKAAVSKLVVKSDLGESKEQLGDSKTIYEERKCRDLLASELGRANIRKFPSQPNLQEEFIPEEI